MSSAESVPSRSRSASSLRDQAEFALQQIPRSWPAHARIPATIVRRWSSPEPSAEFGTDDSWPPLAPRSFFVLQAADSRKGRNSCDCSVDCVRRSRARWRGTDCKGSCRSAPARAFPYGTLVVNLIGCLLLGGIAEYALTHLSIPPEWRIGITYWIPGSFHHLFDVHMGDGALDSRRRMAARVGLFGGEPDRRIARRILRNENRGPDLTAHQARTERGGTWNKPRSTNDSKASAR